MTVVIATRAAAGIGSQVFSRLFPWSMLNRRGNKPVGEPRRILFIRSGGIGDSIIALGGLRAITLRHPGSVVDILGAKELRAVCEGLDFVGEIIPVHRLKRLTFFNAVLKVARSQPYDMVIDGYTPHPRVGFSTALILAASRAPMRVGRSPLDVGRALTHLAPPRGLGVHFVDEMFDVANFIGAEPVSDRRPPLKLRPEEKLAAEEAWAAVSGASPRVLINISAGHSSRHWEIERYLDVARAVRRHRPQSRIVIVGHGQPDVTKEIAAEVGGVALQGTLRYVMALVAQADLVITPDTSISHVAAAFDRIIVSLHQAENFPWTPYKARGKALFSTSFFTINFIDAETVVRAVSDLLDSEPALQ
jgi:ADP-heptose:LPS heptosyltransferase